MICDRAIPINLPNQNNSLNNADRVTAKLSLTHLPAKNRQEENSSSSIFTASSSVRIYSVF